MNAVSDDPFDFQFSSSFFNNMPWYADELAMHSRYDIGRRHCPDPYKDCSIQPLTEIPEEFASGKTVLIAYIDEKGDVTHRAVTFHPFIGDEFDPRPAIYTWCHLRRETRTFTLSRIFEMVIPDTGELVSDIEAFTNYPGDPVPESETREGLLFAAHISEMRVLFFAAKADGSCDKKDRIVLRAYLQQKDGGEPLDDDLFKAAMDDYSLASVKKLVPALRRLSGQPVDIRNGVYATARHIILNKRKFSGAEVFVLWFFQKRLRLPKDNIFPAYEDLVRRRPDDLARHGEIEYVLKYLESLE